MIHRCIADLEHSHINAARQHDSLQERTGLARRALPLCQLGHGQCEVHLFMSVSTSQRGTDLDNVRGQDAFCNGHPFPHVARRVTGQQVESVPRLPLVAARMYLRPTSIDPGHESAHAGQSLRRLYRHKAYGTPTRHSALPARNRAPLPGADRGRSLPKPLKSCLLVGRACPSRDPPGLSCLRPVAGLRESSCILDASAWVPRVGPRRGPSLAIPPTRV